MLAAVKIKEEPLDELDDLQEVFRQQETLMKQQFLMDKIKGMSEKMKFNKLTMW